MVRKLAGAVCLLSLVPISVGALVTTLKAGMAFADWPSSDGHNMLLYPWFKDIFDNPAKFTEHGHRLAGMLIGFLSIGLAVAAWRHERQRWVRVYAYSILGAVIGQGLLGGARVLLDKQVLAMLHSVTGSLFFCLCVGFLVFTRPSWRSLGTVVERRTSIGGLAVILVLPVVVMGQYLLGGALRHLHTLVDEHIAGAVITALLAITASWVLLRSDAKVLKHSGWLIITVLALQVMLGLGSYLLRFGWPPVGYVAVSGSLAQAVICSSHTVVGMFLLASTFLSAARVYVIIQSGGFQNLRFADRLPKSYAVAPIEPGDRR